MSRSWLTAFPWCLTDLFGKKFFYICWNCECESVESERTALLPGLFHSVPLVDFYLPIAGLKLHRRVFRLTMATDHIVEAALPEHMCFFVPLLSLLQLALSNKQRHSFRRRATSDAQALYDTWIISFTFISTTFSGTTTLLDVGTWYGRWEIDCGISLVRIWFWWPRKFSQDF